MTNIFNVNETLETFSKFDLTGKKKDSLNQRANLYRIIYNNHLIYLNNIVSNLFIWDDLPTYEIRKNNGEIIKKKIRSAYVELMLGFNGQICFTNLPDYGYIFSPCTVVGQRNIYGDPIEVVLSPQYDGFDYKVVGKKLNCKDVDFVMIQNDNFGVGFGPLIYQTAYMLSMCMLSSMVNTSNQKFPTIIYGSADSKLSLEILTNKVDSFEDYIYLKDSDGLDMGKNQVFNRNLPFVADKVMDVYKMYLDNFFQRIGINSVMFEKKERLITDEVNANNQAVRTSGDVYLNNRVEGCENISEVFGVDIKVGRNNAFIESLKNEDTFNDMSENVMRDYENNEEGGNNE